MTALLPANCAAGVIIVCAALLASASTQRVSRACSEDQFRCQNGQCIQGESQCDGRADCKDKSDEIYQSCGHFTCSEDVFRCDYGACIDLDLKCNNVTDCADGSDEESLLCKPLRPEPPTRSAFWPPIITSRPIGIPFAQKPVFCRVPPQPDNGRWKGDDLNPAHSDMHEGIELKPGSHIVCHCLPGYRVENHSRIFCDNKGHWSDSPVCVEIKCSPLNSASTRVEYTSGFGDQIAYGSPLLPRTKAKMWCRPGYRKDTNSITSLKESIECQPEGMWKPDPIKCVPGPLTVYVGVDGGVIRVRARVADNATGVNLVDVTNDKVIVYTGQRGNSDVEPNINVRINLPRSQNKLTPRRLTENCGKPITHQIPFVINGVAAQLGDFPWHATLYAQRNTKSGVRTEFQCGGTIIYANFVLTAAHCVYDEHSKKTWDPETLFVMTGNIFRDYDSLLHNPETVRKRGVKKVHVPCNYYGFTGNYASDIALLELESPFELSGILLPACLDLDNDSADSLVDGELGKVAGFGRTATGATSGNLQTINVPFISQRKCLEKARSDSDKYINIMADKFCAGYTNGSAVCEGDSGGGLVFEKGDLFYVVGIVSVGLGVKINMGERTCDSFSYTIYTKVSNYKHWIEKVITNQEHYQCY